MRLLFDCALDACDLGSVLFVRRHGLVYSKAQTSIQYPSTILKFVVEWPQH
jgi:hypothetical protein